MLNLSICQSGLVSSPATSTHSFLPKALPEKETATSLSRTKTSFPPLLRVGDSVLSLIADFVPEEIATISRQFRAIGNSRSFLQGYFNPLIANLHSDHNRELIERMKLSLTSHTGRSTLYSITRELYQRTIVHPDGREQFSVLKILSPARFAEIYRWTQEQEMENENFLKICRCIFSSRKWRSSIIAILRDTSSRRFELQSKCAGAARKIFPAVVTGEAIFDDGRNEFNNEVNCFALSLNQVPKEIFQCFNLRNLNLSRNELRSLPLQIYDLKQLRSLSVSENHLISISSRIGELVLLEIFYCSNNHLKIIPPEIGLLKNLRHLGLHHNQLTHIPLEIGELSALEDFNISSNHLSSLPAQIERCTSLTSLDISDNQFSIFPPKLVNLPKLKYLYLMRNKTKLPKLNDVRQMFNPIQDAE